MKEKIIVLYGMTSREKILAQAAAEIAAGLEGKKAGPFVLTVVEMLPIRRRAGWVRVAVAVRDRRGAISKEPVMTGIVSGGGRGVKPWIECRLFPSLSMGAKETIDARGLGLEADLVGILARLVPPGGHLMVDYESPGQEETFAELVLRVPPPASYLGSLMFRAGLRGEFKDWYFSEGGHEGPRKLQANKSPDKAAERRALASHRRELSAFVARPAPEDRAAAAIIARAQARARKLLREGGLRTSG